jgi:hypothetical protein
LARLQDFVVGDLGRPGEEVRSRSELLVLGQDHHVRFLERLLRILQPTQLCQNQQIKLPLMPGK